MVRVNYHDMVVMENKRFFSRLNGSGVLFGIFGIHICPQYKYLHKDMVVIETVPKFHM